MRQIIFLLTILLVVMSCRQTDKQKELELKERELALKEKEFELKEKGVTVNFWKVPKLSKSFLSPKPVYN